MCRYTLDFASHAVDSYSITFMLLVLHLFILLTFPDPSHTARSGYTYLGPVDKCKGQKNHSGSILLFATIPITLITPITPLVLLVRP